MKLKNTIVVAGFAAIACTGLMAQAASAETYRLGSSATGYFYFGTEPGREMHGGYCQSDGTYYGGWISPTEQDADFDDACPATASEPVPLDPVVGQLPAQEVIDQVAGLLPGDAPQIPLLPREYVKVDDPSGAVLGEGGGVIFGTSPDRGFEGGICNKNTAGGFDGYYHAYVTTKGPAGGEDRHCTADAPGVGTRPASNVTTTTATLNGVVNPRRLETHYWFEAGPEPGNYTLSTRPKKLIAENRNVPVKLDVAALEPGKTYYYRVVARNQTAFAGGITAGAEVSFATPAS